MTDDARRDAVVVLARGASRRMGSPKVLLAAPGYEKGLLVRVAGLYVRRDWPVLVVTLPEYREAAAELVAALPQVEVVAEPSGGDTAPTVLAAWRRLRGRTERPTHLWAHPVDLPGVAGGTLDTVLAASVADPARVLRATCRGEPGHPVVLPAGVLETWLCRGTTWTGPLRGLLDELPTSRSLRTVETGDEGTVRDLDTPGDLAAGGVDEKGERP